VNRLTQSTAGDGSAVTSTVIDGGQTRYMRANAGNKLEAFQFSRPGDGFERLMDRLERASLTAIWPYELVWNPSSLGGVNGRMVMGRMKRFVSDRQDLLRPVAKRRIGYAVAKAMQAGSLPWSDDWWRWDFGMPPEPTADFGRERREIREDIKFGLVNHSDGIAELGKSPEEHWRARANDIAMRKRIAREVSEATGEEIDAREMVMMTANDQPDSATEDPMEPEDPKDDPKKKGTK
jgi:hypothetical protein